MTLYAVVQRVLAALTYGLVWLLAAGVWIVQPLTREVRWAGLVVIGVAIWVQHRPRGNRAPRA